MAFDRVQVMKQESTALGGDDADAVEWGPTPIEPQEDAIEAAGLIVQDATNRDETTVIDRLGLDMRFKDGNNPTPKTLTELLSGAGGLTESGHRALRQLIHFIEDGPAEGFASGAFKETTGTVFPTFEAWYVVGSTPPAGLIVSLTTTWTGPKITQEVWKMYDVDGSTVLVTVTDNITYSGIYETSRVRAIA